MDTQKLLLSHLRVHPHPLPFRDPWLTQLADSGRGQVPLSPLGVNNRVGLIVSKKLF